MPASPSSPRAAWDDQNLSNPHLVADKARRVEAMFAAIAPSYDLNNRVHSLGRDQAWRRAAVKLAELQKTDRVVDVACGTGDLSLAFASRLRQKNPTPASVLGIDFTFAMLPIAVRKASQTDSTGRGPAVAALFGCGDAMSLPLSDACCDVVSIAFGIRNVADPARAMREFYRVLRPGGRVIVLEFSLPTNPLTRGVYNFYFKHIMPRTATWIARDKSGAYRYLPQSVNTFIGRETMVTLMTQAGFTDPVVKPLTMGIAVIYRGTKP